LEIWDFAEIVRLKNPVCEQSNLGLSDWHAIFAYVDLKKLDGW
jgi:hypothetical protein